MAAKIPRNVAAVYAGYPAGIRKQLKELRALVFDTAARTDGVGALSETLKWGEPAYLTSETGSGTTIRLSWRKKLPTKYGLYVPCQTNLVDRYRSRFGDMLSFDGDRGILFDDGEEISEDAVATCIAEALTYHAAKRHLG